MARKDYDPAIAGRIKKSSYDYICSLAEKRVVPISTVVAEAMYEYEEKCRKIQESFDKRRENAK